jgi:hypothetical protein
MEVGERDEWDYRIIGDLIYLTNFILEDIGSERTFHLFNYDEYLYATEKQVAQMQEKFRIADSD